jgi:hypothetical protein
LSEHVGSPTKAIFETKFNGDTGAYELSGTTFFKDGTPIGKWNSKRVDIDEENRAVRYVYSGNTDFTVDPQNLATLLPSRVEGHGYARIQFYDGLEDGTGSFFDDAGNTTRIDARYRRLTPTLIKDVTGREAKSMHPAQWGDFIQKAINRNILKI